MAPSLNSLVVHRTRYITGRSQDPTGVLITGTMNKLHVMVVYLSYFWSSKTRGISLPVIRWMLNLWRCLAVNLLLLHVLWSSSLPLSRHLATLLFRLGQAWLAPALLHCREVQESSRIELGGFLIYKSNPVYHRPLSSWRSQQFGDISAWRWIWTWVTQNPDSLITEII